MFGIEAATSGHSQALIEDAFATSASVATQQMLVFRFDHSEGLKMTKTS